MPEPCRQQFFTPPQVARMWVVEPAKVIGFIESGELKAVNLAERRSGKRPRYKISQAAIDAFLASRAVQPPPPKPARRRKEEGVIEFY